MNIIEVKTVIKLKPDHYKIVLLIPGLIPLTKSDNYINLFRCPMTKLAIINTLWECSNQYSYYTFKGSINVGTRFHCRSIDVIGPTIMNFYGFHYLVDSKAFFDHFIPI